MNTADNRRSINAMAGSIDDCHGDEHLNDGAEMDIAEKIDDFWSSESLDDLDKFMGIFGDDATAMVLLKKACSWPTNSNSISYEVDIINLLEYVRGRAAEVLENEMA